MRDRQDSPRPSTSSTRPGGGFTLTELLVVIAIIGIIIAFILVATRDGVRRAEEKATLSLIVKLETGLSERMEAILLRRADVVQAHVDLAGSWYAGMTVPTPGPQRAQVIAQFDLLRAELPDVFLVQGIGTGYPINFAMLPYPSTGSNYSVPLGSFVNPPTPAAGQISVGNSLGVYGATYQAAAGITKNLGYLPQGYDGADNNNNGLIDEYAEGIGPDATIPDPDNAGGNVSRSALIARHLANHTHNTARAETLYALLVEGIGPLGSVFSRDDFTQREVGDTDSDGLPEFLDAWGQPLQFYRWPIYYNSVGSTGTTSTYVQKGSDTYGGLMEVRQTDPLDTGQSLVAPGWFSAAANSNPPAALTAYRPAGSTYSASAAAFMTYFHSIIDPNFASGAGLWDRSGFYSRRAFYSRPLIISSGPDKQLGVAELGVDYRQRFGGSPTSNSPFAARDNSGAPVPLTVNNLIRIENQAAEADPNRSGSFSEAILNNDTTGWLRSAGLDDISNQNLAMPGGSIR